MKNGAGHLAAFLTVLVWGVTFISTKILLRCLTPLEILFLRFLLGYCALWLIFPRKLKVPNWRMEFLFALAGLFGVTLYFLLENIALTQTLASNVGVIVATAPFFTALLSWRFLDGEKPGMGFFIGFIMAMTGICMISLNDSGLEISAVGDFLALLAALAWAVYTIFTRKLAQAGYASIPATRRVFFYGLLFMLPCMLVQPFSFSWRDLFMWENITNLVFLGIGASAICFASWTFAIKKLGAAKATAYIYLVPVITIISAGVILKEPFGVISIAGALLAIGGVALSQDTEIARHMAARALNALKKEKFL